MALATAPIFHLVYVSQASEELGYNDIEQILNSAKIHNPGDFITGVLIHADGFFVQLLEGPTEVVVKQKLARILLDERHNNLRVIGEWYSAQRLFKQTTMGFCDSDIHKNKTCFSYIQKLFSDATPFAIKNPDDLIQFFIEFSSSSVELK